MGRARREADGNGVCGVGGVERSGSKQGRRETALLLYLRLLLSLLLLLLLVLFVMVVMMVIVMMVVVWMCRCADVRMCADADEKENGAESSREQRGARHTQYLEPLGVQELGFDLGEPRLLDRIRRHRAEHVLAPVPERVDHVRLQLVVGDVLVLTCAAARGEW